MAWAGGQIVRILLTVHTQILKQVTLLKISSSTRGKVKKCKGKYVRGVEGYVTRPVWKSQLK